MQTFLEWLSTYGILARLRLLETYYSFDPAEYNALFDSELQKLRVSNPQHQHAIESMRGFNWVGYIGKSVRNAGYRDQREVQERTHDVVAKLLMGTLFRNYDERVHGPLDLRFKRSVSNAIRNMAEKERNQRRLLPSVPIDQEFRPGGVADLPDRISPVHDERVIADFRQLLRDRLGDLAVAIFDLRMDGGETKSLIGSPAVGSPSAFAIKAAVQRIKVLAREYAGSVGDPMFVRDVERAFQREAETVQKRQTTARQRAGT
jgi:hypothetical protein